MPKDKIFYVRACDLPAQHAFSRLLDAVRENKQEKALASQWLGWVKGLTQKGVKQAEMKDSGLVEWLERHAEISPKGRLSRQDVINLIERRLPSIKIVDLGQHQHAGYTSLQGGSYQERLYILSSESMLISDLMEDVFYRIQELGFDPSPLMDDPTLVDRLEAEVVDLEQQKVKAWDFSAHHYSDSVKRHGKNLLAHARTILLEGNFFIQEIQSDWGQKGRRNGWGGRYPEAPFVTNTEQWAGLVLNDLLQQAARNPDVHQVTWVRAHMRNGWNANNSSGDNLAEFYDNIVRRLVEKKIAKTGARVQTFSLLDKQNQQQEVMGFVMTNEVREALKGTYALYSRDHVFKRTPQWVDEAYEADMRARVMKECEVMLGSAQMVRFFNRLYDTSNGIEVPGRYFNDVIELSWRSQDPIRVARHEAMHYAYDHLLLRHERRVLDEAFAPGTEANKQTQDLLLSRGLRDAARECRDSAQECAAYAFEYWARGEMEIALEPQGVFQKVVSTLEEIGSWIRRLVNPLEQQTAEEVFDALKSGVLARRQRVEQEMTDLERCQQVETG